MNSGYACGRVTPARRRRAIVMGLVAAAVFSVTFVLNRKMADGGGHWAWSTALRFLMMMPILCGVIGYRRKWGALRTTLAHSPGRWILWGTVGSGIFYATLAAAGSLSPAWVVAGTWPVAIVIGVLLAPFLYRDHRRRIERRALFHSLIVMAGVALLQSGQATGGDLKPVLAGLALVLVSATAHPIGNRKSMLLQEEVGIPADAYVRLVALILGSLPFLAGLCLWGYLASGFPPASQLVQSAIIAACGAVATPLFYAAADSVGRDAGALAAVEATQATEMIFTLLLEAMILGVGAPGIMGAAGMVVILYGIILHARPEATSGLAAAPEGEPD